MLYYDTLLGSLPIIGIPSSKSRSDRSKWLSESEYLCIPKSFLAFLVGFIDGDGAIVITRNQKRVNLKIVISLHMDDISTLNYIQSTLKMGKIHTYPSYKSPTVRLIFNKTEIQEVLFPLLLHHGIFFLTKPRRGQYNTAMYILKNNIILSLELIKAPQEVIPNLPKTIEGYVSLPFFKDWIVGFVCAEGSFLVKAYNDACFQIKQRMHVELFEAFKLIFNTNRRITVDQGLYTQFGVSSKADIQRVINFFSFSGYHFLVGKKYIQYSVWLEKLRNSSRYGKLNYPS